MTIDALLAIAIRHQRAARACHAAEDAARKGASYAAITEAVARNACIAADHAQILDACGDNRMRFALAGDLHERVYQAFRMAGR